MAAVVSMPSLSLIFQRTWSGCGRASALTPVCKALPRNRSQSAKAAEPKPSATKENTPTARNFRMAALRIDQMLAFNKLWAHAASSGSGEAGEAQSECDFPFRHQGIAHSGAKRLVEICPHNVAFEIRVHSRKA